MTELEEKLRLIVDCLPESPFKAKVRETHAEAIKTIRDAARYRWLVAKLQEAYDSNDLEIGDLVVGCSMQYGHRNERCVMGLIRWIDARDEPLNLDAAIDAAMKPNAC